MVTAIRGKKTQENEEEKKKKERKKTPTGNFTDQKPPKHVPRSMCRLDA